MARKRNLHKELLTVTTKSGRSITVTPDHQLLTFQEGIVKTIVADKVEVGQYMPITRSIPTMGEPITLNLLDILTGNPRVHIVGAKDWIKGSGYAGPYAEKYFSGRAFPITLYDPLKSRAVSVLPQTTQLQIQNSTNHTLPTKLNITPDMAWLLGLYIAEGLLPQQLLLLQIETRKLEIR